MLANMKKYLLGVDCIFIIFLCFIVASHCSSPLSGQGHSVYKSGSKNPVYNGLGNANGDPRMRQASGSITKESPKAHQGFGMSAWGIIGVITGSLLLGTVLYYVHLFYPILCKKERKYDIMDLTPV